MAEPTEPAGERATAAYLLAAAIHLQQAAVRADRLDVAAKADEVIALLADAGNPVDGMRQPQSRGDARNAVLKILDGLGF